MTSRNGSRLSLSPECSQLARIWPKKAKTSPPRTQIWKTLSFLKNSFHMCPHKGSVTLVLERAENLGRGLFPSLLHSHRCCWLQTGLSKNKPSRETLKTASDVEMHNNVQNILQLSEKCEPLGRRTKMDNKKDVEDNKRVKKTKILKEWDIFVCWQQGMTTGHCYIKCPFLGLGAYFGQFSSNGISFHHELMFAMGLEF